MKKRVIKVLLIVLALAGLSASVSACSNSCTKSPHCDYELW